MKLIFGGDIVISDSVSISEKVKNILKKNDYRIFNFEGAVKTEKSSPLIKAGPHVYNALSSIDFLKLLHVDLVGLANNHIMEYGRESLEKTISLLKDNGICVVGAGFSFEQIYRPFIIPSVNEKICILNACQAEFGVAKSDKCATGYSWVNSPVFRSVLKKQLEEKNKVVLFLHAGMEEQIVPLPEWKQVYHGFADIIQGRGAIIATHPHIVQGYEIYNDTPIFYSLGNFAFYKDGLKDNVEWNRSILVQYDTITNATEIIPVSMRDKIIDVDNTVDFQKHIEERSSLLKDTEKLEKLADEIAEKSFNDFYKSYYQQVINAYDVNSYSIKRLVKLVCKRILNKIFKTHFFIADNGFDEVMLLHNIQIESHRWCVERYLYNKNLIKNNLSNDSLYNKE